MRGETPQGVFFAPDLAHTEPVRIDVFNSSECPAVNELLQPDDGGMVMQEMADHQHAVVAASRMDHLDSVLPLERKRFLDEHILTGGECSHSHVIVPFGRCSQNNCRNLWI